MNAPQLSRLLARSRTLGLLLLVTLLLLPLQFIFIPDTAFAGGMTSISDTLSNSRTGVASNHVIAWTSTTAVTAGQTIKVRFDPATDAFGLGSVVAGDLTGVGFTIDGTCAGPGSDRVAPTFDAIAPDVNITLTVCAGDSVAGGAKTLTVGNLHATNPGSPGTYVIRIQGTQTDSGDTLVVIRDWVTLSAGVDQSLEFTVIGLASGQAVNTETTSTTTTATAIAFGYLSPSTPIIAGQELAVSTNATEGFVVTVQEDQNLTSGTGADIDVFKNGMGTAVPVVWAAPTAIAGSEDTYGHFGVTSGDTDLNGGEFSGAKYAGNFATTSRVIFSHNGPADGLTQDIGRVRVAYKIEISGVQEAGTDYSNHLIYVCTPTF